MDYNQPLLEGQFLKRYKRFFADVKLGEQIVVAHVPNTGSLNGICDQPRPCRLLPSDNPERKLKFTLEQVQTPESWVGVNTQRANELAWEAFQLKKIPHWQSYFAGSREIKLNAETRLDLKLWNDAAQHFVEVKSVTLSDPAPKKKLALFPDAVTTRGQKHLLELIKLKSDGASTELLFIVQREDCINFSPAVEIDAEYGRLLNEASKAGVKISIYPAQLSLNRVSLDTQRELKLLLL